MAIQERAKEWCNSIINRLDTSDLYRGYIQGAVEERSEFKEYLEKKKEEVAKKMKEHILYSQPEEFYHNRVMFCNEIIDELFGETEQDNSDREE